MSHRQISPLRLNYIAQNVRLTGHCTPYARVHDKERSAEVYTSCMSLRDLMGQQVFMVRYRLNKEEQRWECSQRPA